MEEVDRYGAWAYFDEASQGDVHVSGVGRVLYLRDSYILKYKVGLVLHIKMTHFNVISQVSQVVQMSHSKCHKWHKCHILSVSKCLLCFAKCRKMFHPLS